MESAIAIITEWVLFLLGLLIYLVIRCLILIIRVCIYYPCRGLWISLIIFPVLLGISGLLALINHTLVPAIPIAGVLGFIQLSITAKVVEINGSGTFMKEPELLDSVLHTNWFHLH